MIRQVLLTLLVSISPIAHASLPLEASLSDLACGADHILVGRVIDVDMVNADGKIITDGEAMTGPGLGTSIRLHVEVLEVIESNLETRPSILKVPLDPMMHYSLEQVRTVHERPSEPMLVFLRGNEHQPVIPGRFLWQIDARTDATEIRKRCPR